MSEATYGSSETPSAPSKVIEEQIVEIDYRTFEDITFRRCIIVFKGGEPPTLRNVAFDECSWSFDAAARNTIELLRLLVDSGEDAKKVVLDRMLGVSE